MSVRCHLRDATNRGVVALAVVAAGLTLYQATRPGLLLGATPDVAVYLGGAVRLVHGAVPYRDYVFVQPPGFVVLTTPIAVLSDLIGTRDSLGLLRLLTPLLAASNVLFVGRLIRHRGLAATLVACTVMACFPALLYAIRGPQLEPVVDFFCLLGAVLVFDRDALAGGRRLGAGGVALGLAVTVKLSAGIPVALLLLVCMSRSRRRAINIAAGVVSGFAVVTLPFVAIAPASFWHDTVSTQLGRVPATGRATVLERLGEMTGLSEIGAAAAVVIAVTVVLSAFVVLAFIVRPRRPTPLEWFALSATAAVALAQLAPAQYYPQYAALLAPFASLVLGLSVARVATALRRPRAAPALAGIACVALLLAQLAYVSGESAPDFAAVIDAVVPAGACALSNSPVYLVTADRFRSTARGCTQMTDPAGTMLALPSSTGEAVAAWQEAFEHVDYVVTDRPINTWQLPTAARIPEYVGANFRVVHAGVLLVYVRAGSSVAEAGHSR
jgi:alpha-1,2-mannosyltransferase